MIAGVIQANLSDAPPASAIDAASAWISDLLFGPLANVIAVIAVAWIGFAMLSGRIDIRRGLSVIFGCFLLFGARGIADGLRSSAIGEAVSVANSVPPPPAFAQPPAQATIPSGYDPYAGAAVMRPGG